MRKWLPLITVCLGTFMLLIDVTIVNVALPAMAKDLKTSFASLQWVVDAYAITLAALVLGTGSLADLIGHRRAYVAGLALFAAASLVCGISPNSGVLVVARAVQGVGGAAMFATTFALLNSNYSGRDRGMAYGIWGAVVGASAAVGPIVGGLLTEGISWRWIFFVNLPVSVAAIALCGLVLKDAHPPVTGRVDVPGIASFTAAAGSLTYGLINANEHGWSTPGSWGWLAATPVLVVAFIVIEINTDHPMLDLALMRNGSFVGILLAALFLPFAAFATFTYTSIWLQSVLGLSPIDAGLTGLPLSLSAFVVSAAIGRFLDTAKPGPLISGGVLLIGIGGLVATTLLHGSASWPALVPGFMIVGIGVGIATPTLSSAGMAAVPMERGGMAAGAVNTARQLGFGIGVAALGSVFSARVEHVLAARNVPQAGHVSRAISGGQGPLLVKQAPQAVRAGLDHSFHVAALDGLHWAFLVSGISGVVAAAVVYVLVKTPGAPKPAAQRTGEDIAAPAH